MWFVIIEKYEVNATMSIFKKQQSDNFSIDDAFSESSEDKIRLYSNNSETAPLTDTIYEEQEPPDFEGSSLTLSPVQSPAPESPFSDSQTSSDEPPIIKTKSILKNPTLQALKEREDKDVSDHTMHAPHHLLKYFVFSPRLKIQPRWFRTKVVIMQEQNLLNSGGNIPRLKKTGRLWLQPWFLLS